MSASLDEFFAKKDKSRKAKSKAKYTTSDQIAKKLEEGGKKIDKPLLPRKEKDKNLVPASGQAASVLPTFETQGYSELKTMDMHEDEDWKDFEEEKKDYTGLRVQALSISDREREEEQLKDQQPQENGDSPNTLEAQSGPWKVVQNVPAAPAPESVPEPKEDVPEVPSAPKSMAYKPPHLRGSASASAKPHTHHQRNPKLAPEIGSEIHFPSLSAAVDTPMKGARPSESSDKSFQSVKHGLKSKDEASHQGLHLDLENKYEALHSHGELN